MRVERVGDLAREFRVPIRTTDGVAVYCTVSSSIGRLSPQGLYGSMARASADFDAYSEAVANITARAVQTALGKPITPLWHIEDLMRREDIGYVIDISEKLENDSSVHEPRTRVTFMEGPTGGLAKELRSVALLRKGGYGSILRIPSLPQIVTITESDILGEVLKITADYANVA